MKASEAGGYLLKTLERVVREYHGLTCSTYRDGYLAAISEVANQTGFRFECATVRLLAATVYETRLVPVAPSFDPETMQDALADVEQDDGADVLALQLQRHYGAEGVFVVMFTDDPLASDAFVVHVGSSPESSSMAFHLKVQAAHAMLAAALHVELGAVGENFRPLDAPEV